MAMLAAHSSRFRAPSLLVGKDRLTGLAAMPASIPARFVGSPRPKASDSPTLSSALCSQPHLATVSTRACVSIARALVTD